MNVQDLSKLSDEELMELSQQFTQKQQKPSQQQDLSSLSDEELTKLSKEHEQKKGAISEKESRLKNFFRLVMQVPQGMARAYTYPADIAALLSQSQAGLDLDEIEGLYQTSKRLGIPFNVEEYEKEYNKNLQENVESLPTQGNISRYIEEKTGIPLEAKTTGQKILNLGTTAASFQPGTLVQKAATGVAAPAISQTAQALGVPEPVADAVGLGAGYLTGKVTPATSPKVGAATKPSGIPLRRFEKITEPRTVSAGKKAKITSVLEKDFKQASEKILSESPISKIKNTLEVNPAFKSEVIEQFGKVEKLAESMPETIDTQTIKKSLVDRALKNKGTGFLPSEQEKEYANFIKKSLQETPNQDISVADMVKQYRKNNNALSQYYEPGQSKAYNSGKKNALLDYNRSIADVLEEKFPNSEFTKLFKETNADWGQIADVEYINKFFDDMFDGKINYSKIRQTFDYESRARPFKRALGDQYPAFQTLMKDMLSSEKPYQMLKVAKARGLTDFAKTAGAFILHPKLGKAALAYSEGKNLFNSLMNSVLESPQLTVSWRDAISSLKKGDFKEAEKGFNLLKKTAEKEAKPTSQESTKLLENQSSTKNQQ